MKIKTRKFNDKGLTKLIKQAARFYAYQLIPEHYDQIFLDIYATKMKADGTCLQLDNYDYEIEINKNISFECMMITLAHEMIHLKQYATKELKSKIVKGNEVDVWKGVKYKNMKYNDQPWEQEATDLEQELYHKFLLYSLMSGTLDFNGIEQIDKRAS